MGVRFEQPEWLWLALLAAPSSWVALRWFVTMSRVRRWTAAIARAALLVLIALSLAGTSTVRRTDRLAVVAVVDVSGSVRRFAPAATPAEGTPGAPLAGDAVARLAALLQSAAAACGPQDAFGVVAFDGGALVLATPTRAGFAGRSLDVSVREGTNIADALRTAAGLIPSDAAGRLVLVSDGVQTAGDALAAAAELAGGTLGRASPGATPLSVDVLPLTYDLRNEVAVESVDAPPRAQAGAPLTVRVVLRATGQARGTLRLLREGEELDINGADPGLGRRLVLSGRDGGVHVELLQVEPAPASIHRFRAVWEPDVEPGTSARPTLVGDTLIENNAGEAFTISPSRGSVLLVDGVTGSDDAEPDAPASPLAAVLRDAGAEVRVVPPERIPTDLLGLQEYDLIVLENVPADRVPDASHPLLVAFVRDLGGGLIVVGGPDALGAGGWKGTPLEPILPVRLELPEQLVMPEVAIVLVLDRSGSMRRGVLGSSRSQQDVANQAAALAVRSLDPTDSVGVIEFSDETTVAVPLAENSDPEATAARILSIAPGGGTDLGPALLEASRQLAATRARARHVIALTDGKSMHSDQLPGIAARMRADGIVVSTIAIGDDADHETLEAVAHEGGGTFYRVVNPNVLPKVFLKAVRFLRRPMIRDTPFEPVLTPSGSPITAGLDQPPTLHGLVLTQTRPEVAVVNAILAPSGEPVLAHWRVELGQVAVFTSDAHHWARDWLDWDGYRRLWTAAARSLARASEEPGSQLRVLRADGSLRLELLAADSDARPLDGLVVPATVYTPAGGSVDLTLAQVGPGEYAADMPASESGTYIAVAKPRDAARRLPPLLAGASVLAGAEFRALRADPALLREIAARSGGRVLAPADLNPSVLFRRDGVVPREAMSPLWRPLLAWVLVVLLLDVGTRRVAWDRYLSREFGADLRRAAAEAVRSRGDESLRTVSRLRARAAAVDAAVAPDAALGEREAASIREQAELRRSRERWESLRARQDELRARRAQPAAAPPGSAPGTPAATAPPSPPPSSADTAPPPGHDPASSLLAAKRRARERFEDDPR